MRKNVLMVAALIMLLACGGKKAQTESTDTTAEMDSTAILAQEEMTGLIKELYAAVAKNETGIDQLYACHTWRKMVAAVNEKDSHVAEIGFFNDDYWTQMQDSNPSDLEARDIKFEQLDVEKGMATVSFLLHSSVQDVRQKFEFCHEDGNWRVHNIIRFFKDSDGKEEESNLMEGMRNYLDEPLEEDTEDAEVERTSSTDSAQSSTTPSRGCTSKSDKHYRNSSLTASITFTQSVSGSKPNLSSIPTLK